MLLAVENNHCLVRTRLGESGPTQNRLKVREIVYSTVVSFIHAGSNKGATTSMLQVY